MSRATPTKTTNSKWGSIIWRPGTRLLVKSSRARGAFGIVGARLVIADEPGAWDSVGGELMADALDTALGKPGSDLIVTYIGTLAPSASGWWGGFGYQRIRGLDVRASAPGGS